METSTQQQPDYADIDLTRAIELLCEKDSKLAELLHRIIQLEKMTFGPRSSKRKDPIDPINPSAFLPFPGIMELIAKVAARAEERAKEDPKDEEEKAKTKKKGKRKGRRSLVDDIPAGLPRLTNTRELTEAECVCGCGGKLVRFKTETARRIDQVKITYVDERVTSYYACRTCEQVVSSSPDRESIVEGSILGPNILADFVYQRFGNHTPYHRLARELDQKGVSLSRSVIGRNVLKCGEALEPIYNLLWDELLSGFHVQIDDTRVVVRNGNEKGRTQGYAWIYRNQDGVALFDFRMNRSHEGPKNRIGGFVGFIQGDAFSGHKFLFRDNDLRIELGCWAHAARRFRDGRYSNEKVAGEFDILFALLNRVEREAKAMSPPERFMHRAKHARPVLDEIKDWLDVTYSQVLPKSPMGKAISYALNQWQALTNYLLDGRITFITNNAAERAIRRVALGRKNWMHIGSEDAGKPALVLMSIVQTCVEQGVNAAEYLRDVLVRLGQPGSAAEIKDLLPLAWKNSESAQARVAATRQSIAETVQALSYDQAV